MTLEELRAFNRMIEAAKHLIAEHEAHSVTDGDVFDLFRAIIAADYATADVKTLSNRLITAETALTECERKCIRLEQENGDWRSLASGNTQIADLERKLAATREAAEGMALSLEAAGFGRHNGGRMCTPLETYRTAALTEVGEQEQK